MSALYPPLPLCAVLAAALLATAGRATAEAPPARAATCARLRAEARAEAALLYAPRVQLDGARTPIVVTADDPTATPADGLQARLALALSPVDALRGRAIERVASADCAREQLAGQLEAVLVLGDRHGELAATRAELAYLEAHIGEVDAMVADVLARFERQRATALEVDELRGRRAGLRRRIAELHHGQALLEELDGDSAPPADLAALAAAHDAAAVQADRRRADVRALQAWRLDVRAGVAAADRPDWFATVELGYSFGRPWQRAADRRAIHARARELADDPRSVSVRVARLQAAMRRSVRVLADELRQLDAEAEQLRADHARVAHLDSDAARQLAARLTLERIELEARRTSIATLLTTRRPLAGETP